MYLRIKGVIILWLIIMLWYFPAGGVHSAVAIFSLGGITRPGSLGMISARCVGHPFETGQM